jgi:hypothetical protein
MFKPKDLTDVINKAIKKMGVRKENDLCKYLPPMKAGNGHMHHFTLKKMKAKQPQELAAIIDKYVVQADKPVALPPKQRAPRGSRKKKDHMNFTRNQLERMLTFARQAGDREIVTILSPKKSLASCKRELIQAIRHNKVDTALWDSYAEAALAYAALLATDAMTQH